MLGIKENGITLNGAFLGRENFPEVDTTIYNAKTNLNNMECFAIRYVAMKFIVETFKEYYGRNVNREMVEDTSHILGGRLYFNEFDGYLVNGYLISSLTLTEEGRFILGCNKVDEETGKELDEESFFLLA